MTSPSTQAYLAHLETLGIDASTITADERSTVRDVVPQALALPELAELPLIAFRDEDGAGELELGATIGMGGMGVVRTATQIALRRPVAVKLVRSEGASRPRLDLLREAVVAGRLQHPNVIPIYALGRSRDGAPVLVMKHIRGVPWADLIHAPGDHAEQIGDDPLSFHLGIFTAVCNAVSFAHSEGVLHRDLKPDNVMIGGFGEVYLLDWGLAVALDEGMSGLLAVGDIAGIAGTPGYMAPEMAAVDASNIGVRTDVYLLGAVLHEVLTARPLHEGRTLIEVLARAHASPPPKLAEAPEELADVCRRATARATADRYADVASLRAAVEAFLRHRGSRELAAQAQRRLDDFTAYVESAREQEVDPAAANRARIEADFGFRQALREWSDNPVAADGARALDIASTDLEISRGHLDEAARLLEQLVDPPLELSERLDVARRVAEERSLAAADLEALRRAQDPAVDATVRSKLAYLLALISAAPILSLFAAERAGIYTARHVDVLISMVLVAVIDRAWTGWRNETTPHPIDRMLTRALTYGGVVFAAAIGLGWVGGLGVGETVGVGCLVGATIGATLAASLSWVWVYMAVVYLLAAAVCFVWPDVALGAYGLALLLGLGGLSALSSRVYADAPADRGQS